MVLNRKTKAWVDEQNKLNKEKKPINGGQNIGGFDQTYPMQNERDKSPVLRGGETDPNVTKKSEVVPQPTHALTEFVKHVADPLVEKGWNLHLKFGKGESQKEEFVQGSTPQKTSTRPLDKKEVQRPPREKQVPLEMGTGGGGGDKKGGGEGKRPPEDKISFEKYPKKYEDDTSTETSFELEVTPEQLARVNPNRPVLRLKLSPRKKTATAAPGGGGSPPPGGVTQVKFPENRLTNGGPTQLVQGGGGLPPPPPSGIERGGLPQSLVRGRGPPQPPGGGGTPPPDDNGNGNGAGGGGWCPPPRRGRGGSGDDGDGNGGGGGDSPPPSDQGQPCHH